MKDLLYTCAPCGATIPTSNGNSLVFRYPTPFVTTKRLLLVQYAFERLERFSPPFDFRSHISSHLIASLPLLLIWATLRTLPKLPPDATGDPGSRAQLKVAF